MNKKIVRILNRKNIKIMLLIMLIGFLLISLFIPNGLIDTIKNLIQKEETFSFNYEIRDYDKNADTYTILITATNPEGIASISYPNDEMVLKCNGKKKVGFDYTTLDQTNYRFKIVLTNGEEKEEIIEFERPRTGIGTYKKVKGVYVHTPNVSDGFEKEYTRYMSIAQDGNLKPANWITDEEPDDWYDYKNQKWANIFVETNGVMGYYVWIPRYAYKIPEDNQAGNERVDIKFIDVYNNYIDPDTDEVISWEQLKEWGYKIPEAFEFGKYEEISISGYWMSKYELSELESYVINYNLTASSTAFNVSNFTVNTNKEIKKYTYAINGKIDYISENLEDYTFNNTTPDKDNVINITALDENDEIVGSMTKKIELTEVNKPNLEGFDKDTTFYVYWDENENEYNEIPINQDPPDGWYNYTYSKWANIVTRNDGLENYFVWIPRYQYRLDQTSQRVDIRFIQGLSTETITGYQIPEAFTTQTDNGSVELEGYWISKYELSAEEVQKRLDAELAISNNLIRVKDIKGTLLDNEVIVTEVTKDDGTTEEVRTPIELKYEYYINGEKKHEGTSSTENYVFEGLNLNTTYTINIIVREKQSNKYVGAITKKVKTKQVNPPQFDGFVEDMTYYVLYDDNDNMYVGDKIKLDGSNIPNNWYDYSRSIWANIVVTDGRVEDGQIYDANVINYYVWIPRYEYRILQNRELESLDNKRVEINFIEGLSTETSPGYQIPEAFTWNMGEETKELMGYWISKYELSE